MEIKNKGQLIEFIKKSVLASSPTIKFNRPEERTELEKFAPQFYPQAVKGTMSFDFIYKE